MDNYLTIDTVTMFVSVDPKTGYEGVLAMNLGAQMLPLVAADPMRLEHMYPMAELIKANTGVDYRVLQFSTRTDVTEEIHRKYGKKG